MASIATFFDTSTMRDLLDDMTKQMMKQMMDGKDETLAKVFNDLKCSPSAFEDPSFAAAIDWYLEHK